jgi:hypothetical protein
MTIKTKAEVIDSIKSINSQIKTINQERSAITEKLIQVELELNQYQTERDALETSQRKAPSLLITGEMTDAEFDANRKKLAALYELVDGVADRADIYRQALDQKSTKFLSELNSQLQAMRKVLVGLEIKAIAADIASKSDQQLRELAALINHHSPSQNGSYSQFGGAIASALFGEHSGNPNHQDITEANQLAKKVLEALET